MKQHLITLYSRTPLHVGSGTSVDVVDLPIMRERITAFPVIPASSLKGVLLQHARETFENGKHARNSSKPDDARILFGDIEEILEGGEKKQKSYAGCVQIMEGKILVFPVRSLAGCFAWLTCPMALERFNRDTGKEVPIPQVDKDYVIPGSELIIDNQVVLEEYALRVQPHSPGDVAKVAAELKQYCSDPLWQSKLAGRLAVVHDENFQHFVTTCTEVVTRIKVDPATRTVDEGALFNQENVPSEAMFYSVLTVLPPRHTRTPNGFDPNAKLAELLPLDKPVILQIGADETTGHGLCELKHIEL
ncbi:MAG: type III-B CRISPR module RAMP protein Cmr4 [Verrucomicrobiae bacterium]|nr:type III-B CRISPR module RAMP protein Cmr4 [Verrucomicrobiae bacterium]